MPHRDEDDPSEPEPPTDNPSTKDVTQAPPDVAQILPRGEHDPHDHQRYVPL